MTRRTMTSYACNLAELCGLAEVMHRQALLQAQAQTQERANALETSRERLGLAESSWRDQAANGPDPGRLQLLGAWLVAEQQQVKHAEIACNVAAAREERARTRLLQARAERAVADEIHRTYRRDLERHEGNLNDELSAELFLIRRTA